MKELIKEHLIKTIDFLNELNAYSYTDQTLLVSDVIEKLEDAYSKSIYDDCDLHIYKAAYIDYIQGDEKYYQKLVFNNEINKLIDEKNIYSVINLPDLHSIEELDALELKTKNLLLANLSFYEANGVIFSKRDRLNVFFHIYALENKIPDREKIVSNIFNLIFQEYNNQLSFVKFHSYDILKTEITEKEAEDNFDDLALEAYFQSWIDGSVTIKNWLLFMDVDVIKNLEKYDLSEEIWNEIRNHKSVLFDEMVNLTFQINLLEPFILQTEKDNGYYTAKRDLLLINDLFEGNLNEIKTTRIRRVFLIKDCKKAILLAEDILHNQYGKKEDNYDIWHEDSYLYIKALFKYKKLLELFVKAKDESNNNVIPNLIEENIIASQDSPLQLNGLEITKQEESLESNTKKLTQDQIALILIYEDNKFINWQEIATKYEWTAIGSGKKISQHYKELQRTSDRQGEPADPTKTKIRHKIEKIEGILPYLTSDNAKTSAYDDIKALEKLYTKFIDK